MSELQYKPDRSIALHREEMHQKTTSAKMLRLSTKSHVQRTDDKTTQQGAG